MRRVLLLILFGSSFARPVAADDWWELRAGPLTIYSQGDKNWAEGYLYRIRRFQKLVRAVAPGLAQPDSAAATVFVFSGQREFEPYHPRYEGRTQTAGGWFIATPLGNLMAMENDLGRNGWTYLYHEYFHSVVDAALAGLPLWANEGLADYVARMEYELDGAELGRKDDGYLAVLRREPLIPIEEFFEVDTYSETYHDEQLRDLFYAQSWLLVHYLLSDGATIAGSFRRYAELVHGGMGAVDAFPVAFGDRDNDLAEALDDYRQRESWSTRVFEVEASASVRDAALRAIPATRARAEAAMLIHARHPDDSSRCRADIQAGIDAEPDALDLQLLLAAHRADDQDFAGATTILDRVEPRLEPGSRLARDHAVIRINARLRGKVPYQLDDVTPEPMLRARNTLREWITRHPEDKWARAHFGMSYHFEQSEPLDEAITALSESAAQIEDRPDLLVHVLRLHARRGELDRADEILRERIDSESIDETILVMAELSLAEEAVRYAQPRANAGDCDEECLRRLAWTEQRMTRKEAVDYFGESHLSLTRVDREARQTERYNEAVRLANGRRYREADRILAELEDEGLEGRLAGLVKKFRAELRPMLR